jgi:hypothetical protein
VVKAERKNEIRQGVPPWLYQFNEGWIIHFTDKNYRIKQKIWSQINCQSVDNCCIIINTLINHHDPIYLWRCQTDQ